MLSTPTTPLPAPHAAVLEQRRQPAEPRGMACGGEAGEAAADHRHFAQVFEWSCHLSALKRRSGRVKSLAMLSGQCKRRAWPSSKPA